jgi:hypothetical protein
MKDFVLPSSNLLLLCLLLVCLLGFGLVDGATCEGIVEMRSKTVKMVVDGRGVTFTPTRLDGVAINDFFNVTMALSDFTERERVYNDELQQWYCDWGSDPAEPALQRIQLNDWDCSIYTNQSFPHPQTLLESVTINYTHPLTPGFYITNTFFVTNNTFEIRPSSNTTYIDPGKEYIWKFKYVDIDLYCVKQSIVYEMRRKPGSLVSNFLFLFFFFFFLAFVRI